MYWSVHLTLREVTLHYIIFFQESNSEPYANKDAVFTLCYAVIMLNVDQHNSNIKQQKPMTCEVQSAHHSLCCVVLSYCQTGCFFPAQLCNVATQCYKFSWCFSYDITNQYLEHPV